jgi:hypothetical protein
MKNKYLVKRIGYFLFIIIPFLIFLVLFLVLAKSNIRLGPKYEDNLSMTISNKYYYDFFKERSFKNINLEIEYEKDDNSLIKVIKHEKYNDYIQNVFEFIRLSNNGLSKSAKGYNLVIRLEFINYKNFIYHIDIFKDYTEDVAFFYFYTTLNPYDENNSFRSSTVSFSGKDSDNVIQKLVDYYTK